MPSNPPWDPVPPASIPRNARPDSRLYGSSQEASPITILARQLQASASRRIWSTLLSFRDWTSYIYLPLVLLLLLVLYFLVDFYRH